MLADVSLVVEQSSRKTPRLDLTGRCCSSLSRSSDFRGDATEETTHTIQWRSFICFKHGNKTSSETHRHHSLRTTTLSLYFIVSAGSVSQTIRGEGNEATVTTYVLRKLRLSDPFVSENWSVLDLLKKLSSYTREAKDEEDEDEEDWTLNEGKIFSFG